MRRIAMAGFCLLALAAGCRSRKEESPRDYEGARQRSEEGHRGLDQERDRQAP